MPRRRAAFAGMLLGAALISTSPVWVKLADVAPSVSGFYRMAFGAGFLGVWLLLARERPPASLLALSLIGLAALFFAADLYFWHRSILIVGPGLATILANFQVFVLAVVGALFLGERLQPAFLAGLACALTGLWLLFGLGWPELDARYRQGVLFGLLTALCYAAYLLTMRRAGQRAASSSPQANLFAVSLLCALVMAAVVRAEGGSFAIPDRSSLLALLAYGLFAQMAGWWLIVRSMPRLPAAVVGLLLLLQPALAFVWDQVVFGRSTTALEWLGVALALIGIYLGSMRGIR